MKAGLVLREARRAARLTQRALASKSGVPQSSIARIESGRVVPRVDTLERLLGECDMTLRAEMKPGFGVDRTLIRQMLEMTPEDRIAYAAESSRNVAALVADMRRQS